MFNFFRIPQVHAQTPEELVGEIDIPRGVDLISQDPRAGDIGIILFISNMIRLFTIIGGIWIIVNVVFAAFNYITGGGKSDVNVKVRDRLTMSVLGLILMIVAYTVAGLVGLIFYGDATFILNPTIPEIGG